jgi:hypothetical protein
MYFTRRCTVDGPMYLLDSVKCAVPIHGHCQHRARHLHKQVAHARWEVAHGVAVASHLHDGEHYVHN